MRTGVLLYCGNALYHAKNDLSIGKVKKVEKTFRNQEFTIRNLYGNPGTNTNAIGFFDHRTEAQVIGKSE